jgi:hypothetical protein
MATSPTPPANKFMILAEGMEWCGDFQKSDDLLINYDDIFRFI